MFKVTVHDLGTSRLDAILDSTFALASTKRISMSATQMTVDLTSVTGSKVIFTGEGLTYGADALPTGGTVTGLTIIKAGQVVYRATITDLAGSDLAAAFRSDDGAGFLAQQRHQIIATGDGEWLQGYGFDDALAGGVGKDVINGNGGNDRLWGLQGNDVLVGGAGNDTLSGGLGADQLVSGSGADVFVFRTVSQIGKGAAGDRITDFARGIDTIDLSQIDANWLIKGNQAFTFIGSAAFTGKAGQLRLSDYVLSGDTNGDKVADFELRVVGNTPLSDDIIL